MSKRNCENFTNDTAKRPVRAALFRETEKSIKRQRCYLIRIVSTKYVAFQIKQQTPRGDLYQIYVQPIKRLTFIRRGTVQRLQQTFTNRHLSFLSAHPALIARRPQCVHHVFQSASGLYHALHGHISQT